MEVRYAMSAVQSKRVEKQSFEHVGRAKPPLQYILKKRGTIIMRQKKTLLFCCLVGMFVFVGCSSSKMLIPKNTELIFSLSGEMKEILYYASLAPSSHNAQMWKVGVSSDEKMIRLYMDSSRLLEIVDPNGRESLISIGAFLKNLTTALEAFGYGYSVELVEPAKLKDSPLVAKIHIQSKSDLPPNTILLAEMEKRHTEKKEFLEKEVDSKAIVEVLSAAGNRALFFSRGTEEYEFIKRQSIIANELQAASAEAREELAQWLRFSDAEAKEKADGLPAEQLGLQGIEKTFYYATMNRKKAAGEKFGKTSLKYVTKQLESSAGFFVIIGEHSVKGYIEAGIALETLWLAAVRKNISIHPISQGLEEKETFAAINLRFADSPFQMIMRAGYVKDYGINAKIRRPLKEFVFME
jgi:nitroreductase